MTNRATDFNGLANTQPTLPAEWYYDKAQYQTELRHIWYKNWVYVCRDQALAEPRMFKKVNIGDQEIVIVRTDEGELKAFHNTCRHRGSILFTEDEGKLRSNKIICPYHAWAYDLDGELVRTPSKHCPADFDMKDFPLYQVAVYNWRGCIFINLAGDEAKDFETAHTDAHWFKNWPLESLQVSVAREKKLKCNWKIFWENFNECLHCPGVHKELCKAVPIYRRGYMEREDDPTWRDNADNDDPKFAGGLAEDFHTWTADGQPCAPTLSGLSEEDIKRGTTFSVMMPSTFMVAHVDYVRIVRLLPIDEETMSLQAEWLFAPEIAADHSVDKEAVADYAWSVILEDGYVSELNQKGLKSIAHKQGSLMAEEYDVAAVHDWIRKQLPIASDL